MEKIQKKSSLQLTRSPIQLGSGYSGHPKPRSTLGHAHHPRTAARLSQNTCTSPQEHALVEETVLEHLANTQGGSMVGGGADIPAAAIRKQGRKLRGCKRAQLRSPGGCGMGLSPWGSSRWPRTSRGWTRRPPEVPSSLISSVIPWFWITQGCSRKPSWAPCPNILALTASEAGVEPRRLS